MTGLRQLIADLAAVTPAWLRHAVIVFAAAASGIILQAMIDAHGVTAVAWRQVLLEAVDAAAYTTATGMLILTATPATRRYGVGRHAAGASG